MPITPTYPGVYIEEPPSGVHTITPVATSITAFIGSAPRGLANTPVTIQSMADYERKFGGLVLTSPMSYMVSQFFQNGGSQALIVRVTNQAASSAVNANGLPLEAKSPGVWGQKLRVHVDQDVKTGGPDPLFNVFLYDGNTNDTEEFRNLSINKDSERYVGLILEQDSELAHVPASATLSNVPTPHSPPPANTNWFDDANAGSAFTQFDTTGSDGNPITDNEVVGDPLQRSGLNALDKADLFNLLCIPPVDRNSSILDSTYAAALKYCSTRRALLLVDATRDWGQVDAAVNQIDTLRTTLGDETYTRNAAIFFPQFRMPDPLKDNKITEFAPSGAIAGIFARTDVARGVWKAPAGTQAGFSGIQGFTVGMNDNENGRLNPLGVNCLRTFQVYGNLIWGSRTLAGSDRIGSDWKYIPVRRFALFLEESLYRGTQWVVFEPNDEPLWAQVRLNIGVFMHDLFRQGAFQGRSPSDAYYVKCDSESTTQSDINRGIINIEVGFAPLKPAEFVIIKIRQIAGKLEV
jgi:uncharacterized protein